MKSQTFKALIKFSLPFLLSCFLQNFYGLADLFIVGLFNNSSTITAVSVGSQVMHMLTVVIVGLSMGSTVFIGRAYGAKDRANVARGIGNTITLFAILAVILSVSLPLLASDILKLLSVPKEAFSQALSYSVVCFIGVIFITAYNVLSSIYRGLGDTKHPMYFVMIAGIINVGLDIVFIGLFHMGALGAALATVMAQAISVILATLFVSKTFREDNSIKLTRSDFKLESTSFQKIFLVGAPIALQDGLIQVSFLIITMIANRRGVEIAAAVGIVEKIICFIFLIPSAMLSSVSALCAQHLGAGRLKESKYTLRYALLISILCGCFFVLICNIFNSEIIWLFAKKEPLVIRYGAQYLAAYSFDCIFAGIHFCYSGYFCAAEKPILSFIHNILAIALVRIPLVIFATAQWPDNLYPMGLAAPLGSLLSAIICIIMYALLQSKMRKQPLI